MRLKLYLEHEILAFPKVPSIQITRIMIPNTESIDTLCVDTLDS